jgi:hypothetical protein
MPGKGRSKVKKVMGTTPEDVPDTPRKMSNVKLARLAHADERDCSWCFPPGWETSNSTMSKNRRSWKNHRKTQFRQRTGPGTQHTLDMEPGRYLYRAQPGYTIRSALPVTPFRWRRAAHVVARVGVVLDRPTQGR